MLDPDSLPPIDRQEMTARFAIGKNAVNRQKMEVRADRFLPDPDSELSVTRIVQITEAEIWQVGRRIASERLPPRTLSGRADVLAATYISENLIVESDPVPGNPNHAIVIGWPSEQSKQLRIAKQIAAVARCVLPPDRESQN